MYECMYACACMCVHVNTCICTRTFRITWKTCWGLVKFKPFRCTNWNVGISPSLADSSNSFTTTNTVAVFPVPGIPDMYIHLQQWIRQWDISTCVCWHWCVYCIYWLSIYNDIITCTKVWTFYCTFHDDCTIMERKMWSDYQAFTSIYRNKPGFPQKRIQIGSYLWKYLSMQLTERTILMNLVSRKMGYLQIFVSNAQVSFFCTKWKT